MWHSTYRRMRGVVPGCGWMTWSEFDERLRRRGICLSRYHVTKAIRKAEPHKSHGWKRYEEMHVEIAAAYAVAHGFTITTEDHADAV